MIRSVTRPGTALLLLLTLGVAPAEAQDRIILMAGDREISGTVVQATEGLVVVIGAPPAAGGEAPVLFRAGSENVRSIVWGPRPDTETQLTALLASWPGLIGSPKPTLASGDLLPSLRAITDPAVLAALDRAIQASDPRLLVAAPNRPQVKVDMAVPALDALIELRWWASDLLMLEAIRTWKETPRRDQAAKNLPAVMTRRAIPQAVELLSLKDPTTGLPDNVTNALPPILASLATSGHLDEVLASVRPLFKSPDAEARTRAWQSLEGGNLTQARAELELGIADSSPNVRRVVARLLGRSDEPEHGDMLLDLVDDPDRETVRTALVSLRDSKHTRLCLPLIELGEESSEDPELRRWIASTLQGAISGGSNKYGEVWASWRRWWERYGSRSAEEEAARLTPQELRETLSSRELAAQLTAITGLTAYPAYFSNEEAYDMLVEETTNESARLALADLLSARCQSIKRLNPGLFSALVTFLGETKDSLRQRVRALLVCLSPDGIDLGLDATRWAEYAELVTTSDPGQLANALTAILEGPASPPEMKRAAIRIIAKRQMTNLLPTVLAFLTSPDSNQELKLRTLQHAIPAIAPINHVDTLEVLVEFLGGVDVQIRTAALNALRKLTEQPKFSADPAAWRTYIAGLGGQ